MIAAIVNFLLGAAIKAVLSKLGVPAAVATAITPRIAGWLREAADIYKQAKARGLSDRQAAAAVDSYLTSRREDPDRPVTLDDILRSENNPV